MRVCLIMPFVSLLRSSVFGVFLFVGIAALFGAAQAQESLVWQFSEGNDPANKGRATAQLFYGIPETDAVQVSAVCDGAASTSRAFSSVTFGADTGTMTDGTSIGLRFSGGGFSREVQGQVYGTQAEEGISGVVVDLKHDDALWDALTSKERLSYLVPGYGATTIDLGVGRSEIKQFIETCRAYARGGSVNTASPRGAVFGQKVADASGGISEKEAFDSAKELDTIEAWEAFLNSYSTGFRADLARAYVKRLSQNPAGGQEKTADTRPVPPRIPQSQPPMQQPTLSMLDMGAAGSSWLTGKRLVRREGVRLDTARVRSRGVELVTYCKDPSMSGGLGYRVGAVIRQLSTGSYPKFEERVTQGIASSLRRRDNGAPRIDIWFSDSEGLPNAVADQGVVDGEFGIGSVAHGFPVNSQTVERMMAANTMHVSLPPFGATFQLKGSRKAICSMMKRCGAVPAGCSGRSVTPVVSSSRGCSKGRIYSKRRGKCVCPKGKSFRKGRCRKNIAKKKCPAFHELVNGKCWRNDEVNNPFDDGCGPGFKLVKGQCVSRYPDPKPQAKPKGIGFVPQSCRCPGCLWNGKTCKRPKGGGVQLDFGGAPTKKKPVVKQKPAQQQACKHGRIRNSAGKCVCPAGTQKIGKNCVNVQQLQKGIKEIFSDVRLKRDVRALATLEDGLKLYSYRYVWDDAVHVGVMAQDLLARDDLKDAVRLTDDGVYVVNYGMLGLKLATYEAWQRDGLSSVLSTH